MIRIIEEKSGEQQLDPLEVTTNLVSRVFEPGGLLQTTLGLEHRPQQEAMALQVCQSIGTNESLLFEAGTGVGKSLAYLLPSIFFAMAAKRPCVVATHTISLQEQLLTKDLPLCRSLFEKSPELLGFKGLKATLLAGKANYLCTTRLAEAMKLKGQTELFETRESNELNRIGQWAHESAREGMRQELSPRPSPDLWDRINADSSLCSRKRCSLEECYYQRAKERISNADLIVVNHSLLFALLGAGLGQKPDSKGILFPSDFVILDEAHRVPKTASDHFGTTLGSYAVALTLRRLYHPTKKKGLLAKWGKPSDGQMVNDVATVADALFQYVREHFLARNDTRRVLTPQSMPTNLLPPMNALIRRLREIAIELDENPAALEIKDQAERLDAVVSGFTSFQEMDSKDHVYWIEKYGKRGSQVQLRITPIDSAPLLKDALFSQGVPAILTSATLCQSGKFDRFCKLIGADAVTAKAEDSPFDYQRNTRMFVARDCPDPRQEDRKPYLDHLTELIFRCSECIEGGTLVLFTNFSDLRKVAEAIEPRWKAKGRQLFVHGAVLSRSELRNRFAASGTGLLLGTESFWMGIDVPGSALSQVILTRLPFENPTHPVAEAQAEKTRASGLNPFFELTLPDALSRFRQGIGRLIRKQDDQGIVTILDSRVLRKTYGRLFLSELPRDDYSNFSLASFSDDFEGKCHF